MKKTILILTAALILAGCGGGGSENYASNGTSSSNGTSGNTQVYPSKKQNITINSENQIAEIKKTSNTSLNLNIDSTKDIYILVSSHFNGQDISVDSSNTNSNTDSDNKISTQKTDSNYEFNKIPQKVIDFRKNVAKLLHTKLSKNNSFLRKHNRVITDVNEGDEYNFCTEMGSNYNCTEYTQATAKKIVKNISTKYGNKSLVIWVADNISLSQSKIDKLADNFLQNSDNNSYDDDIYDWDSNIYGEEWGSDAQNIDKDLIGESDIIDILVYKMSNSHIAGYFWSKDNFKQSAIAASNEKIMFYINSTLYDNNEKETFSTLAHEFQHMIHFYQRSVKKDINDETWYNELMSMATEDLLATKMKSDGPRGVSYLDGSAGLPNNTKGYFPGFNSHSYYALTTWHDNDIYDYCKVSSFGAFLLRNYGGAELLHKLMDSSKKDENALLEATGKSDLKDLINEWAEGVILSDQDDLDSSKPRYNFGDFIETSYNGITYKLGSINFFNYENASELIDNDSETVNENGNLYYKAGENLSGNVNIKVNMQYGGDVIVIAK